MNKVKLHHRPEYDNLLFPACHLPLQVLEGVFSQYYGSKSKDQNRNQGLPFIKDCNNRSIIKNLCVLSNNVKLDFSDSNNDNIFAPYTKGLIGTLYSWSVDVECLTH